MEKETTQKDNSPITEVHPESQPVSQSNNLSLVYKSKSLPIIGIILILILLGITGFFIFQNYQLKQQISQIQPTSFPEATKTLEIPGPTKIPSTPTVDPTKEWQSYNSGEYKFSFKYPNDYYLSDKFLKTLPENTNSFLGIIIIKEKNKEIGQPPTISLSIIQTEKTSKEFLDYDFQRELTSWEGFEEERGFKIDKPYIISEKNVQTIQVTALKVERQRIPTAPNSKETWYLVKKAGLLYLLRANYGTYNPDTGEDGTDEKNTLDLIFSTFKFLD